MFTKLNEFTYTYDLTGRKKTTQALDGSLLNYTYDPAGRLSQETKTTSANPYQIAYEYDSAGNRLRMINNNLTHTYTYNALNQLTEENIAGAQARTTKITVTGRMLNSSAIKSITVNNIPANFDGSNFTCSNVSLVEGSNTITVKAMNNLGKALTTKAITVTFAPSNKINYAYDLNGNLTRKTSGTKATDYNYDIENRLTKVKTNGKEALFQYDGEGKRTRLTEAGSSIDYLYDASNVIIERNASGATTTSYLRNPYQPGGIGGIIKGTTSQGTVPESYYLYNAQGSVTTLANTTGVSTNSNDYDSFGNTITQSGTSSNPYQYSTKELDSTGLIYFGARYYDPKIGRFITPDPSGMVDGPNLYLYCNNDPINWIDPWGLCVEVGYKKIIGIGEWAIWHTFIKVTYQGQIEEMGFTTAKAIQEPFTLLGLNIPGVVKSEIGGQDLRTVSRDSTQAM
ncbi:MAG: RHS repeat-associated core domain-containing protein, partial [Candidatus Omnitrophica bacterium]|nr:RHS repeat-associated core domain-containing protein [Candidatus Omnitrophota bacterium]